MSKNQTKINEEDFRLIEIEVDTLAKIKYIEQVNKDTSEVVLSPTLEFSKLKSRHKKTKIILAPDGTIVYPQSLYLVSRLSGQGKIKDTGSIAKALLAYSRFLDNTHSEQKDVNGDIIPPECLTYKSLSKYEEEGAPWRFAEFLLANTRHRSSQGNEAFALSTAKSYMNSVIGFYKWLQIFSYIKNDKNHIVTHFSKITTGNDYERTQHDILAHTKSNKPRQVDMSNIMQMFPRADSTPSYKKLKPMTLEHHSLFDEYINDLPAPFSLMFRLAIKAGTRIDELCHFPATQIGNIDASGLDVIPVQITVTKFNKPRIIEVPIDIYEELEIYKFSKKRMSNTSKRDNLIGSEKIDSSGYLFLSNKGRVYSEKTLEKNFSNLRKSIINIDSSWYYKVHDLRSTYATNWLRNDYIVDAVYAEAMRKEAETHMYFDIEHNELTPQTASESYIKITAAQRIMDDLGVEYEPVKFPKAVKDLLIPQIGVTQ